MARKRPPALAAADDMVASLLTMSDEALLALATDDDRRDAQEAARSIARLLQSSDRPRTLSGRRRPGAPRPLPLVAKGHSEVSISARSKTSGPKDE